MKMRELFNLGKLYVSDFIKNDEQPRGGQVEMKLMFDEETKAVRLESVADQDAMYGQYWYRSGINQTMTNELENIVKSIQSVFKLNDGDLWLDIACNDGTMFKFIPDNILKMGIDPADDTYKTESEKLADVVVQDYFTINSFKNSKFGDKKVKVATTIAMFYDLDDPNIFLKDLYNVLDDNGLAVFQMSYTPLMLEQMAFDNICHEHVYYYTLTTIKNLFEKNGFKIMDCQLNDINGGSFRIYAMKDVGDEKLFSTQPNRDVCKFRVNSLLCYEKDNGYNEPEIWIAFYENMLNLKEQTRKFIIEQKAQGKKIWGYGASTKGNTLLQFFELDNTMIDGIAERSPYKFGLKTVGTNIPIYSEDEMRKEKPDFLLVLPWHFINEFIERESDYLNSGGKFIVPCPKFEVIGLS